SGCQQVSVSFPVTISDNVTYVASYFAPAANYAATGAYFFFFLRIGPPPRSTLFPCTTLFRSLYGGGFPTGSFNATNYWVDVVFSITGAHHSTPAAMSEPTPPAASRVSKTSTLSATFSEPVQSVSISFVLKDSARTPVPPTQAY